MVPMEAWLSVATARACAPYWLESTGWLAVLMSDATAAAMGRLPSAGRPDAPPSTLSSAVSSQKGVLAHCMDPTWLLAGRPPRHRPDAGRKS